MWLLNQVYTLFIPNNGYLEDFITMNVAIFSKELWKTFWKFSQWWMKQYFPQSFGKLCGSNEEWSKIFQGALENFTRFHVKMRGLISQTKLKESSLQIQMIKIKFKGQIKYS